MGVSELFIQINQEELDALINDLSEFNERMEASEHEELAMERSRLAIDILTEYNPDFEKKMNSDFWGLWQYAEFDEELMYLTPELTKDISSFCVNVQIDKNTIDYPSDEIGCFLEFASFFKNAAERDHAIMIIPY